MNPTYEPNFCNKKQLLDQAAEKKKLRVLLAHFRLLRSTVFCYWSTTCDICSFMWLKQIQKNAIKGIFNISIELEMALSKSYFDVLGAKNFKRIVCFLKHHVCIPILIWDGLYSQTCLSVWCLS